MKFLDLFSGIGGFRLGMEQAGHTCVGYCEIDKFSRKSYEAIFDIKGEWTAHDITTVRITELPTADIWCFGFPCQDISLLENCEDSPQAIVQVCSSQLQTLLSSYPIIADPQFYLLRTLKTFLVLTADLTSLECKLNCTNWGMTLNGQFSILPPSFPNTASVYSLSDILEQNVSDKYFLSQTMEQRLLKD